MKNKFITILFIGLILSGCVGVSSKGIFGTGVSVAFDPRSTFNLISDLEEDEFHFINFVFPFSFNYRFKKDIGKKQKEEPII